MRSRSKLGVAIAMAIACVCIARPATAALVTFDTSSSSVKYAVNDGGFWVRAAQVPGNTSSPGVYASSSTQASAFHLTATGSAYSDAGIVLYFDGGLKLGDLQGVSISSTGSPLSMNLWLDTGGDGKFFLFDSSGLLTSLSGDSYCGHNGQSHDQTSPFYMLGGNGSGGTYTLSQLAGGAVAGIGASTPVALWIGITNSGGSSLSADIATIAVSTASQSVPAMAWQLSIVAFAVLCFAGARLEPRRRAT